MAGNRIIATAQAGSKAFIEFTTSGTNNGITLPYEGIIETLEYRKCRYDPWKSPVGDELDYEMEGKVFYGPEGHYKISLWLSE